MPWRFVEYDTTAEDGITAKPSTGIAVENVYPGLCPAIGAHNSFGSILRQFDPQIRVKVCHMIKLV